MSTTSPAPAAPLDEPVAGFVERFVTVSVGTRNAALLPAVARACGCRVSADRRQVTVFLCLTQARAVIENIQDNGVIAVVVTRPSTHRTFQLKGTDARCVPLEPADPGELEAFRESFVQDLMSIGYTAVYAHAILPVPDAQLVAVRFTPSAVFDQTPGPKAGRPLT